MSEMSIECPICFDVFVKGEVNTINTDCGHSFHSSCLLTNISKNGFNCPCCRGVMVQEDDEGESGDDESSYEDSDDSDYDDSEYDSDYDDECEENYLFQGFRWLFQRAQGLELEDEDDYSEYHDECEENYLFQGFRWLFQRAQGLELENEDDDNEVNDESYIQNFLNQNTPSFVSERLKNNGVTYELLVTSLLSFHDEYNEIEHFEDASALVFRQITNIIRPELSV